MLRDEDPPPFQARSFPRCLGQVPSSDMWLHCASVGEPEIGRCLPVTVTCGCVAVSRTVQCPRGSWAQANPWGAARVGQHSGKHAVWGSFHLLAGSEHLYSLSYSVNLGDLELWPPSHPGGTAAWIEGRARSSLVPWLEVRIIQGNHRSNQTYGVSPLCSLPERPCLREGQQREPPAGPEVCCLKSAVKCTLPAASSDKLAIR